MKSDIISSIDKMIEERSLLKHPFYQMWSSGELTLESLAGYSKEYFQLVQAVPAFMNDIIEHVPSSSSNDHILDELVANQKEEHDHIKPWISFAGELGITHDELVSYNGLEKTCKAVSDLNKLMNSFEEGSCAMYAFEKEIPKISQTKLDGLKEFYNITSDNATEYFKLHTEADIRHAASWRLVLENCSSDSDNLIEIASKSISAQHLLLDACHDEYC